MKHAFLITAYKDPEELSFLIESLRKYNSDIYVHIDKRSVMLQREMLLKYFSVANVHILKDPIKVHFGGYSHLKAILILLNNAKQKNEYDYYHTISGQDLPLKNNAEFELFFEKNKQKDFISHFKLPNKSWTNGGLDRIEYYHLNDLFDPKKKLFTKLNSRFLKLQSAIGLKRKQPVYVQSYYGGGTWWSLTSEAINTIFEFRKKHPGFIKHFKYSHCAEEIFFQTILLNSKYKNEIVNNDLRYINWNTKHNSCPAILDLEDEKSILAKEYLFARKFDSNISTELRNKLLQKL